MKFSLCKNRLTKCISAEREHAAVRAFSILKGNKTVIFRTVQSHLSINLRVLSCHTQLGEGSSFTCQELLIHKKKVIQSVLHSMNFRSRKSSACNPVIKLM